MNMILLTSEGKKTEIQREMYNVYIEIETETPCPEMNCNVWMKICAAVDL